MTLISRNTKNQKVGTILKFSSKIIETGKFNTPKTQIHTKNKKTAHFPGLVQALLYYCLCSSLSWVSTGTSILLSLFLTFLG